MEKIGAPIIITTLNRYVHFKRLVESLRKNSWAYKTDVFIGLDYPKSEKHVEGYKIISEYLNQTFNEFRSVTVIRRTSNYGSYRNGKDLRELVLSKYDRFIRTDDDAEFSPNFLEYMNKCLDEYEDNQNVIAVTGYSYPLKWKTIDNATIFKENFICPMWGTGFWTKKYKKIEESIVKDKVLQRDAKAIIINGGLKKMTDVCRQEYLDLCLSPDFDVTLAAKVTDISVRMYMAIYEKSIIVPTISKVRNWGFDGTGEFCAHVDNNDLVKAKNYPYHVQIIDEDDAFVLIKDSLCDNEGNKALMNDFDPITFKQKIKVFVKAVLFVVLGKNIYTKLTLLIRKLR